MKFSCRSYRGLRLLPFALIFPWAPVSSDAQQSGTSELPTVTLSPARVEEDIGAAIFTASLSEAVEQDVTVEWRTVDGTAVAGQDYMSKTGTLAFTPTSPHPTLSIDIQDDSAIEGSETFAISMTSANGTAMASTHEVTILVDEPLPTLVSLTNEALDGLESSTVTDKITATLSAASPVDLLLYWVAENGTAVEGEDFRLVPERFRAVRIPAGAATHIAPAVSLAEILTSGTELDDMLYEGTETFSTTWTLRERKRSDPALGGSIKLLHEIQDNEAPPTLSLTASESSVGEAAGKVTITATLTGGDPRQGDLTVDYATADNTAGDENGDGDYETASGTLTFAPGDSSKTFDIMITNDTVYEPGVDETFSVSATLMDRAGALAKTVTGDASGSAASLQVAIEDDDSAPTLVSLTHEPKVGLNVEGGFIVGNYTATLSSQSAADLYLTWEIADGTAVAGQDFEDVAQNRRFLRIPAGRKTHSANAFTIAETGGSGWLPQLDDSHYEGTETFRSIWTLRERNDRSAPALGAPVSIQHSIADNDAPPTLSLSASASPVGEAAGKVAITAALIGGDTRQGNLTVDYATTDGTAQDENGDGDYEAASGTLTFAPGDSAKTFDIAITNDAIYEPGADETFSVSATLKDRTGALAKTPSGSAAGSEATLNVEISDDDAPTVVLTPSRVEEDVGTATFTASLSETVDRDVTVEWRTVDGTAVAGQDYTSKTGTLRFTTTSRNPTLTIDITDDSAVEGSETFSISMTSANGTAKPSAHEVTILVDEPLPTLTSLTNEPLDGIENSTVTDKITATLSAESPVDLHLFWRGENGTAVEGEDFRLVPERFRLARIPAGNATHILPAVSLAEILTSVTELDDKLYEGTETFSTIWTMHENARIDPALGASITLEHQIQDNDAPPTLSLTASTSPVGEADGKITVTATLTGGDIRQGILTVDYATSDDTAEDENGDGDYEAASGSLTFAPGDTSKTFDVAITNDTVHEPGADETFSVSATLKDRTGSLAKTSTGDASGSAASLQVAIEDDDVPPTVVLTPSRISETAGTATFTASLNGESARDVTVEYGTGSVGDTAVAGEDYTARTGSLAFASSSTSPTFTIDISNDALDEGEETFTVSLNSADGSATPSAHVVTIVDEDDPPSVSLDVSRVDEGDGTVTFTAILGAESGKAVTVEYATSDGTAEAGEDYASATGTLRFAKGDTRETFTVDISNDILDEDAETFEIELSSADGTAQASAHEVTITDDDDPPTVALAPAEVEEGDGVVTFTATLGAESGKAVTVEYATSDGTARAGEDYASATGTLTFAAGVTRDTFTLGISEDSVYEGDETFDIALTSSDGTARSSTREVTISDNESVPAVTLAGVAPGSVSEDGGARTFGVTAELDVANATRPVTVSVDARDGTARIADGDYEDPVAVTLTIPQGERSGTANIEVIVNSDELHEGNETFDIALVAPQGANLGRPSSSPVTIIDQDSNMFSLDLDSSSVAEGGMVTATVTLLAASAKSLRVDYATVAGTAREGDDYIAKSGRLTFRPGGALKQEFEIEIVDDALDEDNETFAVALSNPDGADSALGTALRKEVTIADDDPLPTLTFTLPRSAVAEGGMIEAKATLTPASGREVSVDYETGEGQAEDENGSGDYASASGTLTFAPGETAKTFFVRTADDRTPEGDENFEIVLSGERNAVLSSPAARLATIMDDDATEVSLIASSTRVAEGGTVVIAARLSVASEGLVQVHCATSDGAGANGATAGEDYVGSSATLRFLPGEREKTLRINIPDDALDEGDETFSVTLSNPRGGGAVLGAGASRKITILDNDELPTLTLALDRASVEEGGRVVATATLSPASGRDVTVEAAVVDGTTDIRDRRLTGLTGGRLAFAKGDTSESFVVEIADDRLNELAETFEVVLRNPDGARLGSPISRTVTIAADDADPEPSVQFSKATGSVREGDLFEISARLSAESGREVTVRFETSDVGEENAATAGQDYVAMSGTLTFAPGQTEQTFSELMVVMADGLEENSEVFDVALSAPVGATMGAASTMRVTILDGDDPILKSIASHLIRRAEAILDNLPRLIRFLPDPENTAEGISLKADGDGARADGGFALDEVWGEASGTWSSDGGSSHRHFLGTIGAHRSMSNNLLVGGMLQLDAFHADLDGGNGEIDGRGWMAGPYFAARDQSGRVHFEGRLLYGRSSNDIAGFVGPVPGAGARKGSFDTARWLAQVRVEGKLPLWNGALMIPLAELGHAGEEAESFRDSVREVERQSTSATRLSLGTSFEIPVETAKGNLMIRPGLQFLLTKQSGGRYGESSRDSAGRFDFGVTYEIEESLKLELDCFYSGIGRSKRSSFGAGFNLRKEF